jgi:hypothetical protein
MSYQSVIATDNMIILTQQQRRILATMIVNNVVMEDVHCCMDDVEVPAVYTQI